MNFCKENSELDVVNCGCGFQLQNHSGFMFQVAARMS